MHDPHQPAATPASILVAALRRALPGVWWALPAIILLAVAGFALALVPPLLIRRLVDGYLATGLTAGLWQLAGLYLAAYLAASGAGFAQTYVTTVLGQHLLFELRMLSVGHLVRLPISFYGQTPVGDTISRVTSDVDTVSNLFSSGLLTAFTDLFRIGGVLAGMYIISPRLFLISLVAIPLIYVVTDWFRSRMYRAEMVIRRSVGELNSFIQETFSGLRVIKAYGREADHAATFQVPLDRNVRVSNAAAFYVSAFPCVTQLLRAVIIAMVIWAGARTSFGDTLAISIGGLAAMIDLVGRLLDPVEAIANEVQVLQQALAGLRRLAELLSVPPEPRAPAQRLSDHPAWRTSPDAISLHGVSYGYQPGHPVVTAIDLVIPRGVKVALVGRTGAGKTTIMNLMAGLFAPWEGTARICGIDPHSLEPSDRRRLIGVVPQSPVILEGTVHENVTLRDPTINEQAVIEACKAVGLHEQIGALPGGYDTVMGAAGARLSFGQMQLLSIARAIVADPPVLLLDEPTSGMDAELEQTVYAALRAASSARTIVTISHRVSGIIDAEVVYVLANGRVVQSGPPRQLAGERGWYAVFRELEDLGWQVQ
jgi:ATP-binding cassette subfamily B protein